MGHAYKLLYIFRPIVWMLVAALVVLFGKAFLKKLLNAIAIFLFAIGIIGGVYMISYFQKVLDPYYFATADEWSQCIVGSVTVICFLMCAVAYLLVGQTVDKENGEETKHKKLKQSIAGGLFSLVLPFAVMGYCLPFFFLDAVAGIIVGIIGEIVGLLILFAIIRSFKKKNNQRENELDAEAGNKGLELEEKNDDRVELSEEGENMNNQNQQPVSDNEMYNDVMAKVKKQLGRKYSRKSLEMSFIRKTPGYLDCKFGGVPFVPEGGTLPVDLNNGNPLYLLLQINFAQMPQLLDYPTEGILQIFVAGWDDVYGLDFDDATNQNSWRIIYYDDLSNPMDEEKVKQLVDQTYELEDIALPFEKYGESYGIRFEEKEMLLPMGDFRMEDVLMAECKDIWPKEWGDIGKESDLPNKFRDMLYDVFDGFGSRIGGYPAFTQTDPREYTEKLKSYVLLLQVDSMTDDEGWIMMWGDVGIANFFISPEDLKNKDFSKVAYNWDCH